jgi:hypothetical protein
METLQDKINRGKARFGGGDAARYNSIDKSDPALKKMFEKEKGEHPEFSDDQVWQIVEDHLKEKENESQDLSLLSPIALDKYMGALSDVGLQTILDGEHDEEIKKVAQAHQGNRAQKKEEEMLSSSSSAVKENQAETLGSKLARGNARFGKRENVSLGQIDQAWMKMSKDERKAALRETGSWASDWNLRISEMGGSQQDVMEDWVKEHKL